MKIYLYKLLTFFFLFFIFYKLTIGLTIREIETKISFLNSKENIEFIKDKLRKEVQNLNTKDRYISVEDAILINKILNKIKNDLNVQ